MKIFTHYDIEIEIDESRYSLVVYEPTKEQKREITEAAEELKKLNAQTKRAAELKEDIEANAEISKLSDVIEKVKLLLENKRLKSELREIERTLEGHNATDMSNDLFFFRLELTTGGEDRERFLEDIRSKGVNLGALLAEIGENIVESRAKK